MRSWTRLALISIQMSFLVGCVYIQAAQKPVKLYEGHMRPKEELALLNFCAVIGRPFPGTITLTIDGKDVMSETYSQAPGTGRYLNAPPCRGWILPGAYKIYYKASGSKWPGSAFKGIVDFKADKTYYFIFDSCGSDWLGNNKCTSAWLEDDDGDVVAGTKLK